MTRLGDFWKFSATTFIAKVAQLFGKLFGHFEKQHYCVHIFGNFWRYWAAFYSTIWSHWIYVPSHYERRLLYQWNCLSYIQLIGNYDTVSLHNSPPSFSKLNVPTKAVWPVKGWALTRRLPGSWRSCWPWWGWARPSRSTCSRSTLNWNLKRFANFMPQK